MWRYVVTKADLVNAMAEKAGLSKTDAEKALKAFADAVTGALKAGEKVALVGFGTFSVSARAARTGKNPQTGAKINLPAAKTPKFKAGKALKDSVN
jgi:DNA-binding protein HU-beta